MVQGLKVWNSHIIRMSRRGLPSGRPNIMLEVPSLYGTRSYLTNLTPQEIDASKDLCSFRSAVTCDTDMYRLCCHMMHQNDLEYPNTTAEAMHLYFALRGIVRNQLNV